MKTLGIPKFLKRVRYCLAAVNIVYLITGIILLLSGVAVLVINKQYDFFITQKFYRVPAFAIATGVIIVLSSGLGFYAAISEQFIYIASYVAISLVVLIFEISVVIIAFGLSNNSLSELRSGMSGTIQLYERREVAFLWDTLQMEFECCGVAGRHDWPNTRMPVSCCHIDYGTVSPFVCALANAYTTSCAGALSEWLSFNAHALGVAALFVTCLQICNTIAASWLAYRSKFEEIDLES